MQSSPEMLQTPLQGNATTLPLENDQQGKDTGLFFWSPHDYEGSCPREYSGLRLLSPSVTQAGKMQVTTLTPSPISAPRPCRPSTSHLVPLSVHTCTGRAQRSLLVGLLLQTAAEKLRCFPHPIILYPPCFTRPK